MTIFGWDASHYDGNLTKATLSKAKAEGVVFFTHKLGEGLSNVDTTAASALAAARDAGITIIGGYWFCHGNDDPAAEAKKCVEVADKYEPWWRDLPGWFWQADLETSADGLPSAAWAKTFCDTLASLTGRVVIAYASHGMYGDRLKGLGHPLWNANYPSSRKVAFKDLYPGDSFAGWTAYSGQTPVLCQFGSSATIAGLTTCDANAYRGTLAQLTALIEQGVDMQQSEALALPGIPGVTYAGHTDGQPSQSTVGGVLGGTFGYGVLTRNLVVQANATLAGIVKTEAAIQAALATLSMGGTSVDTAALAAQIKAVGDAESAHVTALQQQLVALQGKLIKAEQAAAAAIAS